MSCSFAPCILWKSVFFILLIAQGHREAPHAEISILFLKYERHYENRTHSPTCENQYQSSNRDTDSMSLFVAVLIM